MRRIVGLVAAFAVVLSVSDRASADDKSQQCIAASEKGQQVRDQGQYSAARDAFTQCARDVCPSIVRRDCTRWLSDLTQLWPSLVFGAKDDAGNDVVAVTVRADGNQLATSLDGKPIQIDPGQHVFRFEAAGFPPVERTVVVHAGEKSRLIAVQFGHPESSSKTAAAQDSTSAPAAKDQGPPTSAWVFAGLAVVAFGSEAYFGLSGLSDRSTLESTCGKTSSCSQDQVTNVRTKFTVADIALGVGLASAGLSVYLFLAHPHGAPAPDANTSTSRIDVVPVLGGAAATWFGRF